MDRQAMEERFLFLMSRNEGWKYGKGMWYIFFASIFHPSSFLSKWIYLSLNGTELQKEWRWLEEEKKGEEEERCSSSSSSWHFLVLCHSFVFVLLLIQKREWTCFQKYNLIYLSEEFSLIVCYFFKSRMKEMKRKRMKLERILKKKRLHQRWKGPSLLNCILFIQVSSLEKGEDKELRKWVEEERLRSKKWMKG